MSDPNLDTSKCLHKNVKMDGGYTVCQDCGLIMDDSLSFETDSGSTSEFYDQETQHEYERKIQSLDKKARQDPVIRQKYEKIKTLEKWFKDYKTSFSEQKKTIELLKSYGVGLTIDQAKYLQIKERYLKYNRKHRSTYQNMVIIFLAIVWLEIKDSTNIRIERFIEVCNELGHKISKKMLNNAILKLKYTEDQWQGIKDSSNMEKEVKNKIKILFQKNLNSISHERIIEFVPNKAQYEQLKIKMQLLADELLAKIQYDYLQNLNYKAFTAGLLYYVSQAFTSKAKKKVFTQSLVEEVTKFSSTTIRKKFNSLKKILGSPKIYAQTTNVI